MQSSNIGLVTLGATQGIVLFTTLCPNRSTLYEKPPTEGMKQNLRHGEAIAALLTLGFAGVLAYLSKDRLALVIGSVTVVTLVTAYELTLHMQPSVPEDVS